MYIHIYYIIYLINIYIYVYNIIYLFNYFTYRIHWYDFSWMNASFLFMCCLHIIFSDWVMYDNMYIYICISHTSMEIIDVYMYISYIHEPYRLHTLLSYLNALLGISKHQPPKILRPSASTACRSVGRASRWFHPYCVPRASSRPRYAESLGGNVGARKPPFGMFI